MNNERIAKELVRMAKALAGNEAYEAFDKGGVKGLLAYAKDTGARVSKWKLGDGWKYIIEHAFSSEYCVLYALLMLCKDKGLNFKKIANDVSGRDIKDVGKLCRGIPKSWDDKDIETLQDDLTGINYHSENGRLTKELEDKGILINASTSKRISADTFKCPTCGTKVLKNTGYCLKCKKKVKEASRYSNDAKGIEKAVDKFLNLGVMYVAIEAYGDGEKFRVNGRIANVGRWLQDAGDLVKDWDLILVTSDRNAARKNSDEV